MSNSVFLSVLWERALLNFLTIQGKCKGIFFKPTQNQHGVLSIQCPAGSPSLVFLGCLTCKAGMTVEVSRVAVMGVQWDDSCSVFLTVSVVGQVQRELTAFFMAAVEILPWCEEERTVVV